MQNLFQMRTFKLTSVLKAVILFSLFICTGYMFWYFWPTIMLHSIKWQQVINEELSNLLYQAKENQQTAAVSLLSLSILYGALHAIGPGHGKMIVTTFLATHPSKVKHSLILTVVSAFMQALVAILLVSSLVFLFNNSMRDVNGKAVELINLSFLVMIGLGGMIIFRAVKKLFSSGKVIEKHEQGDCHGCGHKHFADADEINTATTWQAYAGIIISIGIRPCSGAILALLFANMLGIYWLGVMSAFMMALGTAISTSAIALLTLSGKKLINQYLHHDEHKNSTGNSLLQLLGGVLLTLMGLLLFNTPTYGVSPIF